MSKRDGTEVNLYGDVERLGSVVKYRKDKMIKVRHLMSMLESMIKTIDSSSPEMIQKFAQDRGKILETYDFLKKYLDDKKKAIKSAMGAVSASDKLQYKETKKAIMNNMAAQLFLFYQRMEHDLQDREITNLMSDLELSERFKDKNRMQQYLEKFSILLETGSGEDEFILYADSWMPEDFQHLPIQSLIVSSYIREMDVYPNSLMKLYFKNFANKILRLPEVLYTLSISDYNYELRQFPRSLRFLQLINYKSQIPKFPIILKELSIEEYQLGVFEFPVLPESLEVLTIKNYKGPLPVIPASVRSLTLFFYEGSLPDLPDKLEKLELRYCKLQMNRFPEQLKFLTIYALDGKVPRIPDSVKRFVMDGDVSDEKYIYEFSSLKNLIKLLKDNQIHYDRESKEFVLGVNSNIPKNFREIKIDKLRIGAYGKNIDVLPDSLKDLCVENFLYKIQNFPSELEYLEIKSYKHILPNFPFSLRVLKIQNYHLKLPLLPNQLQELYLKDSKAEVPALNLKKYEGELPVDMEFISIQLYDKRLDKIPLGILKFIDQLTYKTSKFQTPKVELFDTYKVLVNYDYEKLRYIFNTIVYLKYSWFDLIYSLIFPSTKTTEVEQQEKIKILEECREMRQVLMHRDVEQMRKNAQEKANNLREKINQSKHTNTGSPEQKRSWAQYGVNTFRGLLYGQPPVEGGGSNDLVSENAAPFGLTQDNIQVEYINRTLPPLAYLTKYVNSTSEKLEQDMKAKGCDDILWHDTYGWLLEYLKLIPIYGQSIYENWKILKTAYDSIMAVASNPVRLAQLIWSENFREQYIYRPISYIIWFIYNFIIAMPVSYVSRYINKKVGYHIDYFEGRTIQLPLSLKKLVLENYSGNIRRLPNQLDELWLIGKITYVPLFSRSVKVIYIKGLNKGLEFLSPFLKILRVEQYSYNLPPFPDELKNLNLVNYDGKIPDLTESIVSVHLSNCKYIYKVQRFPDSITKIYIEKSTSNIPPLPLNVHEVELVACPNVKFTTYPPNLKILKVEGKDYGFKKSDMAYTQYTSFPLLEKYLSQFKIFYNRDLNFFVIDFKTLSNPPQDFNKLPITHLLLKNSDCALSSFPDTLIHLIVDDYKFYLPNINENLKKLEVRYYTGSLPVLNKGLEFLNLEAYPAQIPDIPDTVLNLKVTDPSFELKYVPQNLNSLSLVNYPFDLSSFFTNSLRELHLEAVQEPLPELPEFLVTLSINIYQGEIPIFPKSIRNLTLKNFTSDLMSFPPKLKTLHLDTYNGTAPSFPKSLISLTLVNYIMYEIPSFPPLLQELIIKKSSKKVPKIPPSVKIYILDGDIKIRK